MVKTIQLSIFSYCLMACFTFQHVIRTLIFLFFFFFHSRIMHNKPRWLLKWIGKRSGEEGTSSWHRRFLRAVAAVVGEGWTCIIIGPVLSENARKLPSQYENSYRQHERGGEWRMAVWRWEREVSIIKKYFPTPLIYLPFPLVSLYFTQQVDTAQGEICSHIYTRNKKKKKKKMLFFPLTLKMRFFLCWNRETVLCAVPGFCVCGAISAVRLHAKLIFIFLIFFSRWKNILLLVSLVR